MIFVLFCNRLERIPIGKGGEVREGVMGGGRVIIHEGACGLNNHVKSHVKIARRRIFQRVNMYRYDDVRTYTRGWVASKS